MLRSLRPSAACEAGGLGGDLGLLPGYVKAKRVVLGVVVGPFLGRRQEPSGSSACGGPTVVSVVGQTAVVCGPGALVGASSARAAIRNTAGGDQPAIRLVDVLAICQVVCEPSFLTAKPVAALVADVVFS